jgi:hypothetical protein
MAGALPDLSADLAIRPSHGRQSAQRQAIDGRRVKCVTIDKQALSPEGLVFP